MVNEACAQVAADLSSGGFTKAACPKAVYAMNWEAWRPNGLDGKLQYIAMARTQSDVADLGWVRSAGITEHVDVIDLTRDLPLLRP